MTQSPNQKPGPWAPGLSSSIPPHLMPRITLFDPANSFVDWAGAKSLSDVIGLKPAYLAAFRPTRLALHHVLIRVTAELHVPDGPNYADFGLSLREMARVVEENYVAPEMMRIASEFETQRANAAEIITHELSTHLAEPARAPKRGFLGGLFGAPSSKSAETSPKERAFAALNHWSKSDDGDALQQSCNAALARIVGAILSKHGALMVDPEVIAKAATNLVGNDLGDQLVGRAVGDIFDKAVTKEGFYRLPSQAAPVVLNAKGASASGKSTIRAQQQQIAKTQGIDWQDFAVISPDYWRKHLLDYGSLGDDNKYAAMLTGQELELIDKKLDHLMAVRAAAGHVPHLLVDRFRFDSFQPVSERPADSNLLTRFGSKIYMFFMVTPPAETVKRAWSRGLSTGRYKAVDDLLYHNIEAYSGMPDLFFAWALAQEKWVHYEFLDNSVAKGEVPRTIAYGSNGRLVVQDVARMCDIEQFRHVNVDAKRPEDILIDSDSDDAYSFLRRCCDALEQVEFVDRETGQTYARFENGKSVVVSAMLPPGLAHALFQDAEHVKDIPDTSPQSKAETIGA